MCIMLDAFVDNDFKDKHGTNNIVKFSCLFFCHYKFQYEEAENF